MTPSIVTLTDGGVGELLADARQLLGDAVELPEADAVNVDPREVLPDVTAAALAALDHAQGAERTALLELGLRTQDLLRELQQRASAHRLHLLAQVREGLARLSQSPSSGELLDRVCSEAARSCGLRRVMLSRVEDTTWYPWMAHFDGDEELETSFVQHIRGITVDLSDAPVEDAVLRARRPRVVHDASPERQYGPIIAKSRSTSYVVAPITPAGRVVGFLHADHQPDTTAVDSIDRDVLWAFAEGVGRIYERTELLERLRAQRSTIRETFDAVESITEALDKTDFELAKEAEERLVETDDGGPDGRVATAIAELLTEREREVLELMVRGLGNTAIAERLVIKEGTVKSHVKHILRKLGAVNRAEVIARSMGALSGSSNGR